MGTTEQKEKINVLIVEDDNFLANIYQTKFDMEGFKEIGRAHV